MHLLPAVWLKTRLEHQARSSISNDLKLDPQGILRLIKTAQFNDFWKSRGPGQFKFAYM